MQRMSIRAMLLLALLGGIAPAAVRGQSAGKQFAVLIGVEKYEKAAPLHYTINDVRQLARTLRDRGGVPEAQILQLLETNEREGERPTKAGIMESLPAWFAKPGPADTLLIYFSGHGFQGPDDGKLYLAPIECDPQRAVATGVPVEWLRDQLKGCRAKVKLLVIDACHAGTEKGGASATSLPAKSLTDPFSDINDVVTLASSDASEKSQIWTARQQSLFTFWLNQGLKGHADTGDGVVDIDELYRYVSRNVERSVKLHPNTFPLPQSPRRHVSTAISGVPAVIQLKPQSLKQVLADMAEQLAWDMQDRRLDKVGVLEFTEMEDVLGRDFGLLGKYCAEEMERFLGEYSEDKYKLVSRRRLQSTLSEQGFTIGDLGSETKMMELSRKTEGLPVVALGTLRSRAGRVVSLQCKLLSTVDDDIAGHAAGTALLNESEWAMIGRSVYVRTEDRRPPFDLDPTVRPMEDVVIERFDLKAKRPNPLLDPTFPFKIRIMLNKNGRYEERKPIYDGNDVYVPLDRGEVFQIWVENHSGELTFMRLLVDGLNTNYEVEENAKGEKTYHQAKRVNLAEGRCWVLDPEKREADGKPRTLYGIKGFYDQGGAYNEFQVVDKQDSLAARQQFTGQIGYISAAFYAPASGTRNVGPDVGVALGERRQEGVAAYKGDSRAGNLQAIVHIRYASPAALRSLSP